MVAETSVAELLPVREGNRVEIGCREASVERAGVVAPVGLVATLGQRATRVQAAAHVVDTVLAALLPDLTFDPLLVDSHTPRLAVGEPQRPVGVTAVEAEDDPAVCLLVD